MKRLNHGFHVDFVLVILKCDLLYYLHLHFCSDFVVVLSELKLVHCQDYIVFLCQNQTCLILCCFIHVLLCYCVCHVACIYQVFVVLDESFVLLFQYLLQHLWFVQVITCMDVLTHYDYSVLLTTAGHSDLVHNQNLSIVCAALFSVICFVSPLVRTVLFKPSLIFFQIFTCNEWFLAFYNTGRFSTMMMLESKYVVEVFYSKC